MDNNIEEPIKPPEELECSIPLRSSIVETSILDELCKIESEITSLEEEDYENVGNPISFFKPKFLNISNACENIKEFLKENQEERHEIIAKYEGKIAFLEEELCENEKTTIAVKEKNRILTLQLDQIRDEYNQLNEDFNSTLQLLKEQIATREKGMEDEEDKLYKMNEIIKELTEEIKNKDNEIEIFKSKIEKSDSLIEIINKDPRNDPNSAKNIENMGKKYKSLEKLYMQQIQSNAVLQDKIQEIETNYIRNLETKIIEQEGKIKNYENLLKKAEQIKLSNIQESPKNIFRDNIPDSPDEYRKEISNLLFEKSQNEAIIIELEHELKKVFQKNQEYEFKILTLNNRITDLKDELTNKFQKNENNYGILEASEQLGANDYDLTKSLDLNDSDLVTPVTGGHGKNREQYKNLAQVVKEMQVFVTDGCHDFEVMRKCVEMVNGIKECLEKHGVAIEEKSDMLGEIEKLIEKRAAEKKNDECTKIIEANSEINKGSHEELDYHINYSEPSPRGSYRNMSHTVILSELKLKDSKIQSKKKQIILHKEQINCLKKQIREVESQIAIYQSLDLNLLKTLIKHIFEVLPKLDEKIEKEVELCMSVLGFSGEDYALLKNLRLRKSRFKIFG
ncbi:hypothetical protein SteCoe_13719 [Stentor coeruleus]|uniref:Uncharacterized protein n=1 Tax=Stentor coeruleus TaxID=5963 RepID=A0A1R2C7R9_9CILI|nr:hypothetical protein SteCoe_13719 [Stentor coeruleus]